MTDNERKPAAAAPSSSVIKFPDILQGSSKAQRMAYANAFLARCTKVDPNDFNLPLGTYICPWMPMEPKEEKYYEAGNCSFDVRPNLVECRNCGLVFEEDSYDAQHHVNKVCSEQLSAEVEGLRADYKASLAAHTFKIVLRLESIQVVQRKCNYSCENYKASLEKHRKYLSDPWRKIAISDDDATKDMNYWSSRCAMKSLPLLYEEVMRRPDILCSKAIKDMHGNKKMDFGTQCFQASLIPTEIHTFPGYAPCGVQTTWLRYDDSLSTAANYSNNHYARYRLAYVYTKDHVWSYNQRQTTRGGEMVWRPFTPVLSVPSSGLNHGILERSVDSLYKQHGGSNADVWTTENYKMAPIIKPLLEDLASITNDCPLPRYQMIIDPNQFVRFRDGKRVWVPCEFDVASDGSKASLVGGERAHWMDTAIIDTVATPVLSAALPMLAKLTKPHLLVEGQRLQVVVKAQSITVPKKQPDDDPPEYIGLWHVDGEHEPVAAVVLYYYDVDDALVGGNMEMMDRRPITVLSNRAQEFPPGSLRQALRPDDGSEDPLIPNCSVPIKTGTLLVFSNYQMAHRVLRMVNTSQDRSASRKFVALFIMDPAAERLVPARSHLAHSYLYRRALTGKCGLLPKDSSTDSLPSTVAQEIMEYLGLVPSTKERRRTRNELLHSQLLPKHTLGQSDQLVCTTGNGCVTMIGWIDSLLIDHQIDFKSKHRHLGSMGEFDKAEKRVNALNFPSKEVGRGLSETLSIRSDDLNFPSFYDTLAERKEQLNADSDKMHKIQE